MLPHSSTFSTASFISSRKSLTFFILLKNSHCYDIIKNINKKGAER